MGKRLNTELFIKKAIDVHGFRYSYSMVNYKNSKDKVKIICEKHNPLLNKKFGTLHSNTKKKEEIYVKAGYKVISVWESDFIKELGGKGKAEAILKNFKQDKLKR